MAKNTEVSSKWAMKNFTEWFLDYIKRNLPCPESILTSSPPSKEELSKFLTIFIAETRNRNCTNKGNVSSSSSDVKEMDQSCLGTQYNNCNVNFYSNPASHYPPYPSSHYGSPVPTFFPRHPLVYGYCDVQYSPITLQVFQVGIMVITNNAINLAFLEVDFSY